MSQPAAKTVPGHLLRSNDGVNAVASGSSVASAPPRSSSKRPALKNGQSTALPSTVGATGVNSSPGGGGNSSISSGSSSGAHTGGSNGISNGASEDASSPEATAALIRRILGSSLTSAGLGESIGWQGQLPNLTSDDAIDEQLYAIIAVALKEYVHKWYGKLTPDHRFTDEVINIIAHCTELLDARARSVDWIEVVGDQLAQLVEKHITNLRAARASTERSAFASVGEAYHALNPHPAMQPPPTKTRIPTLTVTSNQGSAPGDEYRQQDEEAAYRQLLVRSALAVLLPRKDMKNPTLRILVGDLIADLILGSAVAGRLCEGWMIWESIGKAVATAKTSSVSRPTPASRPTVVNGSTEPEGAAAPATKAPKATRLERSGLLEMVSDSAGVPATDKLEDVRATKLPFFLLRLLTAVNVAYIVLMRLVSLGKQVYAASSLPCREDSSASMWHGDATAGLAARTSTEVWAGSSSPAAAASSTATTSSSGGQAGISSEMHLSSATSDQDYESSTDAEGHEFVETMPSTGVSTDGPISGVTQAPAPANGSSNHQTAAGVVAGQRKKPILLYAGFSLIDSLLQVSRRMPWLSSAFDMARFHLVFGALGAGDTNGTLDKFLYSEVKRRVNGSIVPPILLALRSAVFPNNAPAPPRTIPTVEEQLAIRRRTAEIILSCIPASVASHLLICQRGHKTRNRLSDETKTLDLDNASKPRRWATKQDGIAMSSNYKDGCSDVPNGEHERDMKEDEQCSLSSEAIALEQIEEMLDIFGNSYCNRHLVYEAVELVLVKLLPEIGDKTTSQLVSESIEGL